jgi:hypothetical protein
MEMRILNAEFGFKNKEWLNVSDVKHNMINKNFFLFILFKYLKRKLKV